MRLFLRGGAYFLPTDLTPPEKYALRCCCLWGMAQDDDRLAMVVKEGIGLGLGRGSIPLRYYLAAADSPAEAARRCNATNRARQEAAAGFNK